MKNFAKIFNGKSGQLLFHVVLDSDIEQYVLHISFYPIEGIYADAVIHYHIDEDKSLELATKFMETLTEEKALTVEQELLELFGDEE